MYMDSSREEIAGLLHTEWQDFLNHLFKEVPLNSDGTMTIPLDMVTLWNRQQILDYGHLSETEQSLYLKQAKEILCSLERIKWQNSLAMFQKKV